MTNNSITIRAIATFKIEWPTHTYRYSNDDVEDQIRDGLELSERVGGLGRTVLSLPGANCVQSFGFDIFHGAVVRYAVPDTLSNEDLQKHGDTLTESFYRECGIMVESERARREANDINGPLWTLELKEL